LTARSIIVCDDEPELAYELAEFLESNGWRVLVCASIASVKSALIGGFPATCLLTDLRVSDGDGAELLEWTRQLPQPLRPAITAVITGHAADPASGSFGADLIFFKPVDPFAVLSDVNRKAAEIGDAAAI
jgi:CheY-like chemotaxis protein